MQDLLKIVTQLSCNNDSNESSLAVKPPQRTHHIYSMNLYVFIL